MVKAKKHLGQHFLTSIGAVLKIIKTADLKTNDFVLEIGPGKGVLTEKLLEKSDVLAVEKDREMIVFLKEKFKKEIENKKLILLEGDILEENLEKYLKNKKYKIVANIPYYITGEILRKFLEAKEKPILMVLLMQNEVAKRIVTKEGKESILSISVKIFGKPEYISKVSAGSFFPKPKVDSAILKISQITKPEINTEIFFNILKEGFLHKRKKLISNLSQIFEKEDLKNIFQKLGLDENIRPEDLDLEKWINLTQQKTA